MSAPGYATKRLRWPEPVAALLLTTFPPGNVVMSAVRAPQGVARLTDLASGQTIIVARAEGLAPAVTGTSSRVRRSSPRSTASSKDGGVVKRQRKLIIVPDDGSEPREYALPPHGAQSARRGPGLPRGVHVNVHQGERVRAGEQLMDGPSNPHDIRVASCGCWARRNCRSTWVRIEDGGDTEFQIDEQTDKFRFAQKATLWRTSPW